MGEAIGDFHFLYPGWLWLLLLLPILWLRVWWRRSNESRWQGIVDERLAPFVLIGGERRQRFFSTLLISMLSLLAILALAGPAWEKREIPAFRKQQLLVVALDLSASMYVRDAAPNRLDAARFKLLDLLKLRNEGQTALVVFAGDAFVVSPLTDDSETIAAQVKNLSPEIMPVQGSSLDLAINRAQEILDQNVGIPGHILLITDGTTDRALALQAATKAAQNQHTVSVLGVGTAEGGPIPMSDGSFLIDSTGQTVIPRLDIAALKAIAHAGGGVYSAITLGDSDLQRLETLWDQQQIDSPLLDGDDRQLDHWFNQGIWLVLLLLPVSLLLFRRGWLGVWLLVMVVPVSQQVEAAGWDDLWLTQDQQGQQAFQAGDMATAGELFNDPDWQAATAYRAGNYTLAEQLYGQSETLQGKYNYGNALAMQGKVESAIRAYEEVLAENPEHEDARYNLEMLKRQQEQQQAQQGQNSQQNNASQQQQSGQQSNNDAGDSSSASPSQAQDGAPAQQQEQLSQQQEQEEAEQNNEASQSQDSSAEQAMDAQTREQKQATEQWLRRIPDDPAGLWRRKFQYQYRQRSNGQNQAQGEAW